MLRWFGGAEWRLEAAAVLLLLAPVASAQEEVAEPNPAPSIDEPPAKVVPEPAAREEVQVVVVGTTAELRALKASLATWRLGERTVSWTRMDRFERHRLFETESDENIAVRCWIDLSAKRTARLYFANRATQRFLVRTLETSGRLDELDREALGQTVELSLLALLDDSAAGLSRSDAESLLTTTETPAPKPLPEPEPIPPAPEPKARWELGAFYGAKPALMTPPWAHGPGLLAARVFGSTPQLALFLQAQYQWQQTWPSPVAGLRAQTSALRFGAEVRPLLFGWGPEVQHRGQYLALRATVGLDIVGLTPLPGDESDATVTAARRRLDMVYGLGLMSLTQLSYNLALVAGFGLDFVPSAARYEVNVDGETEAALRARVWRPELSLGLNVAID